MNLVPAKGFALRKAIAFSSIGLLALSGSTVAADASMSVTPKRGSYGWSTADEETGGAREIVNLNVIRGNIADFDTVRGICAGNYGVLHIFNGKTGRAKIEQGEVTKSKKVTLDGDTAKVTVNVKWTGATKAAGWIKVTGRWAGQRCSGTRESFRLAYSK